MNDFGCLCFLRIGQQFSGDPDGTLKVAGAVHVLIHSTPAPSDSRESSVHARPLRLADDHEREAMGPQGEKVLVKVPFSPGDLVIWKQSAGSYRENPERVARVVKMIIKTQNPDWNDMQVLLDTLMDSTEKEMVLRAMKERAREMIRLHLAGGTTVNELVPSDDPGWNPNGVAGREAIREYQELLVEGIRTGMPKTINWSKLYTIRQDKNESPSAFLERLKETARRFTDLEIDSEAGKLQLALIFLGQTQEDIRKKLQKLEGHETRDLDKMLEVAWKVYNNREKETAKKQQANILAIMQQAGDRGRGRGGFGRSRGFGRGRAGFQNIGFGGRGIAPSGPQQGGIAPNQCAFCRQIGHWKNECPVKAGLGGMPGAPVNSSGGYPMNPEVKKPNGKYRLVQDLRAINKIVKDIHPVVANPYTLLTSVSEKFKWFSVVDLKDAFFCIPLALESRKYFAFEWESPDTGRKRQLTWSRLPQGFKNSPTIFGNQLAKELEEWKTTEVRESPLSYVILQYVDDIFLATEEKETCLKLTIALLNMLGQAGYRVSKEKAQLLKESVIYLGCEITQGQRWLGVN
ncbi:hypothetical protein DUI87_00802 [Hirundo rustica rustica]|uniref:ribonuclease H n=1 Tax=Hirundo rustica rustica TaxID=333673 RepID=A0A3M0LLE4_HIRRU|nr:hypothetical protein DUI87_00802 [Hirundo rustica rustica]